MRLIDVQTLQLVDFTSVEVPPYAILSHTWGEGEVTFQDMINGSAAVKKGYTKLTETCKIAASRHSLQYAWVDTCCIDKSSSAELTESINSMFNWYRDAVICLVWLEDLQHDQPIDQGFPPCRWFTRGFTLQELLAPKSIEFYDAQWNLVGNKQDLRKHLAAKTRIPVRALSNPKQVFSYCIAARVSWAAGRCCQKVEDTAYSLLGLCDVNMPLIYGEGKRAFRRLQEEIVKRNNDLTIFAWDNEPDDSLKLLSVFAESPDSFAECGDIKPFMDDQAEFSVTNKGLVMAGGIESPPLRMTMTTSPDGHDYTKSYVLFLGHVSNSTSDEKLDSSYWGGIYLRKIGPTLFCRDNRLPMAGLRRGVLKETRIYPTGTNFYILIDRSPVFDSTSITNLCNEYRQGCLCIPEDTAALKLAKAAPADLWDEKDRIFLNPSLYPWPSFLPAQTPALFVVFVMHYEGEDFHLLVICRYENGKIIAKVTDGTDGDERSRLAIIRGVNEVTHRPWSEYLLQAPKFTQHETTLDVIRGGKVFTISVALEEQRMRTSLDLSGKPISLVVPQISVQSSVRSGSD